MGQHAALRGGKVSHNMLYLEMQACEVFGLDPDAYFKKAREVRKALAGYVYGRDLVAAMSTYEARQDKA